MALISVGYTGGSGLIVAFSLSLIRSLVYVFYITGGPRDLMPYIPTLILVLPPGTPDLVLANPL